MPSEIIAKLSNTFNAKAADVRAILTKYNAQLSPVVSGYYSISGVQDKDADKFIKEFSQLKGVEAAYKKPQASPPL